MKTVNAFEMAVCGARWKSLATVAWMHSQSLGNRKACLFWYGVRTTYGIDMMLALES